MTDPRVPDPRADLRRALAGGRPVLLVASPEEGRARALLAEVAAERYPGEPVRTWSSVQGLHPDPEGAGDTRDPVVALEVALRGPDRGLYVFCDLLDHADDPRVVRALREAYQTLSADMERVVAVVSTRALLPLTLRNEVAVLELGPPAEAEVLAAVAASGLPAELHEDLAITLRGLTLDEVGHVLRRVSLGETPAREELLDEVLREKEQVVRKTGFLELVPPRFDVDDVGGLDNLKAWLVERRELFSHEAVAGGLPIPKGILLMGVSGCGKSFAAKSVSALWRVPLFRLDMNLIFSGLHGSPEAAFHHALRTVEAVAPVALWIDEIENGLGMSESSGGAQNHLFAAFLTWLQEKPPLVFVAATANRIEFLPPELLRKGRFDQVFFCDLPGDEEREQILKIHLRRLGADPTGFKLDYLVVDTKGWTGAEIEQALIAARVQAYQEGRDFTTDDVLKNTANMVPLAVTMHEKIRELREWTYGRAISASSSSPAAR